MSKKAAGGAKQGAKKDAFDALKVAGPRSVIIDFMVLFGGVGSLVYVFNTIVPG